MRIKICAIHVLVLAGLFFVTGFVYAAEPAAPDVSQVFSPEKENKIQQLSGFTVEAVFDSLRSEEFFSEENYMNKAVYVAFGERRSEAVQHALGYVRSAQIKTSAEGPKNLYIAKKTCQIFPDEALETLLDLYFSGAPKIRRNILYVIGGMSGGEIKGVLIDALDDTASCGDVLPESVGTPLRVCDAAYNQIVIRYNVKDVIRTIGTIHKIEARDYNIEKLKVLIR